MGLAEVLPGGVDGDGEMQAALVFSKGDVLMIYDW